MVRNQKVTQCYHVYAMCHGDTCISKPQQKKIFCHKKIFRCKKIFSSDKNIISNTIKETLCVCVRSVSPSFVVSHSTSKKIFLLKYFCQKYFCQKYL